MRILALDLGGKTGWAIHLPGLGVESGVQTFGVQRGESAGMRFLRFRTWFRRMLKDVDPDLVVYEQPHLRGGAATDLLVGFSTRVQEACACREIEYAPVHSRTLKSHATGRGNASKAAMIDAARARWPDQVVESDDQADALLALSWGLEEFGVSEGATA